MKHIITISVFLGEGVEEFMLRIDSEPKRDEINWILQDFGFGGLSAYEWCQFINRGRYNHAHFIELTYTTEEK